MAFDFKLATPDTSIPATAWVFGADSSASSSPSVFPLSAVFSNDSIAQFTAVSDADALFWTDISGRKPRIWRMRDRVFVGNAVNMGDARFGTNTTWVPNSTAGANWGPRDSQFVSMSDKGLMAVTGMSRTSDAASVSFSSTIGVAGFIINDVSSKAAWAGYFDVQHEAAATGPSWGIEIAAKNKGADITSRPIDSGAYGVCGIWLPAGGDNSYGGSAANPNNAAIAIGHNASTWNTGIVFFNNGLTPGALGVRTALRMGVDTQILWEQDSNLVGAQIRSTVNGGAKKVALTFIDNAVDISGNEAGSILQAQNVLNGENFVRVNNAVLGAGPKISAISNTDTNVDLLLVPQGTGVVQFGTRTALGAETVTGYITIKDAGGVSRKLAVVS